MPSWFGGNQRRMETEHNARTRFMEQALAESRYEREILAVGISTAMEQLCTIRNEQVTADLRRMQIEESKRQADREDQIRRENIAERIRQENREDNNMRQMLLEVKRQDDRADASKQQDIAAKVNEDNRELAKQKEAQQAQLNLQQLNNDHRATENEKERAFKMYIVQKKDGLYRHSIDQKVDVQKMLFSKICEHPQLRDILEVSMTSLDIPSDCLVRARNHLPSE